MQPVVMSTVCGNTSPTSTGKVRDIYSLGDNMLIVTTDRVSAYDVVMNQGVPFKGMVLHAISKWWFEKIAPHNHFITDDLNEIGEPFSKHPEIFRGRSMLVKKHNTLPVEAIIRGYLCGSGWKEYQKTGAVCGVQLPKGLQENMHLLQPIFTPSTKAKDGGHDENITCLKMESLILDWLGGKDKILAGQIAGMVLKESVHLFNLAAKILWDKGIILADTKLEWGCELTNLDGLMVPKLILVDECFTPDSSRFWDFQQYKLGANITSMDKQFLRDWLDAPVATAKDITMQRWDRKSPPPDLTPEVIAGLSDRYLALYERVTGQKLEVEV